jgi:predicted metal-dependent HD superfamily phosphohydrolase
MDPDALRARYAEPHRRYHTVEHLTEALATFEGLRDLASDPQAVELAIWYHDAVYDPAAPAGENEANSAALAAAEGCDDEVVRLILLTAGHEATSDDRNGAVLADVDLAILGAPPERYARYAADVRAEYAHVSDEAWRPGRSAVLRRFLARPRLFVTDRAHAALDGAARRNLAAELAALDGGEPQP